MPYPRLQIALHKSYIQALFTNRRSPLLELQLRGLPTDPITTLRILLLPYGSFTVLRSVDPTAKALASAGRQQCY
jgi:hypothetical protein